MDISELFNLKFSETLQLISSIIMAGTAFAVTLYIHMRTREIQDTKFSDIKKYKNIDFDIEGLKAHIKEDMSISKEEIKALLAREIQKQEHLIRQKKDEDKFSCFSGYFDNIIFILQDKANDAEKQASLALDTGMSYAKYGVWFLIFSMIIWQILYPSFGDNPQFLYGIISCSLLFIFIEFLSAWFLKQYKSFVDTANYLIKIIG